ncbi:hypothetical protein NL676_009876 [Syzygium grande]|nr:hypothetical protein NL676_009876 [Syzygium grande]
MMATIAAAAVASSSVAIRQFRAHKPSCAPRRDSVLRHRGPHDLPAEQSSSPRLTSSSGALPSIGSLHWLFQLGILQTTSLYLHLFKVHFSEKRVQIGGKQPSGLYFATISLLLSEQVPFGDMNLSVSNIVSDNRHMLLGLSEGSLYGISWKGEFCGAVGLDHPIRNESDKVTDLPHPMLKNTQISLAEEQERNRQLTKPVTAEKMETRKAELETNLATNLKRQKQEYEAIISSSETDLHENEVESK